MHLPVQQLDEDVAADRVVLCDENLDLPPSTLLGCAGLHLAYRLQARHRGRLKRQTGCRARQTQLGGIADEVFGTLFRAERRWRSRIGRQRVGESGGCSGNCRVKVDRGERGRCWKWRQRQRSPVERQRKGSGA